MLKKFFSPGPFKTFYLVFAYIIAFTMWWAYLLYAKNETEYKEKIELKQLTYSQTHEAGSYESTDEYLNIHQKYRGQKVMIVTEGAFFMFLLVFGLFRVRKVFLRELELAALQRNFLLSITHELKSPLSSIKLSLQTMDKRQLEPAQTEKLIRNSLGDIDRLQSLVDNILFAAKIERDEPGFSNEEINISELVLSIADRFAHNKKNITITTNIQPDIYFETDPMGFPSVITNLVDNAIKYSNEDTEVTITLKQQKNKVLLDVADQGIGISKEDKEKVFDKFYRVGNEDTRNTKGTGLGLYIVKRFIEIYKGSIYIEDNKSQGSIFRLSFTTGSN